MKLSITTTNELQATIKELNNELIEVRMDHQNSTMIIKTKNKVYAEDRKSIMHRMRLDSRVIFYSEEDL